MLIPLLQQLMQAIGGVTHDWSIKLPTRATWAAPTLRVSAWDEPERRAVFDSETRRATFE